MKLIQVNLNQFVWLSSTLILSHHLHTRLRGRRQRRRSWQHRWRRRRRRRRRARRRSHRACLVKSKLPPKWRKTISTIGIAILCLQYDTYDRHKFTMSIPHQLLCTIPYWNTNQSMNLFANFSHNITYSLHQIFISYPLSNSLEFSRWYLHHEKGF